MAPTANDTPCAPDAIRGAEEMVVANRAMQRVLDIARRIAPMDSTVLVEGESGTGKERVAQCIHSLSRRADGPFVAINCGALPPTLLESQLFGHERGAFTGAVGRQKGLFELAEGGTIFLDEIGELATDLQVNLLRVLQNREVRRLGSTEIAKVDVRVIAATNRDLREAVVEGRFRSDLFWRLNVISLRIPPLRERIDEIRPLIAHFVEKLGFRGIPQKPFSAESIARLELYRWPGNVRELENAVERLLLLARGDRIESRDIDDSLDGLRSPFLGGDAPDAALPPPTMSLAELERIHIANVLRENDGNKMRSARILGINVKTLYNKIRTYGIPADGAGPSPRGGA
ncbi:MAG: sigma-54-dependent Fis family transcriptional regulator [Planctomycetes bacterium]|nr:sigma-54-dependent Fis family transcriptional regulator [Planctomycetota bacterium]